MRISTLSKGSEATGDLFPLIIEYFPDSREYGLYDSRDGQRYVWRHASYDATAAEARRILKEQAK